MQRSGQTIRLTKTEWSLLEALSEHPGKLLTHSWLLERVWGVGYTDDVDVLRVFISQLRRKIETDPGRPRIIATDPGIGYRWLLRPTESPASAPASISRSGPVRLSLASMGEDVSPQSMSGSSASQAVRCPVSSHSTGKNDSSIEVSPRRR